MVAFDGWAGKAFSAIMATVSKAREVRDGIGHKMSPFHTQDMSGGVGDVPKLQGEF